MNCWSASPPLSATGAHWGTLHTIGTARYIQAPLIYLRGLFLCGCNQITPAFLTWLCIYRAVESDGRMQSGITRSDAKNTNTFWSSQLPSLEPAGQLDQQDIFYHIVYVGVKLLQRSSETVLAYTVSVITATHYRTQYRTGLIPNQLGFDLAFL